MRQIISLLSSKYNKDNLKSASVQNLSNFYLESFPQAVAGRTSLAAISTPGSKLWLDLAGSSIRGMIEHKGNIYAVCDSTLYKITIGALVTVTSCGSIGTSGNQPVRMSAIDDEIVVVETYIGNAYSYRIAAATFQQVTAAQFQVGGQTTPVISVVGFQGYFFYLCQNSKTVYYSNLNDGRTVQALNFVSANAFYDNILAIAASENYLYFMGSFATEVWQFSGQTTTLITRTSGGVMQYGIMSPYAYDVSFDNLMMVASDKSGPVGIAMINGPYCQPVEQFDFTSKINSYSHTNLAYSWVDNVNGHNFFNTTIPLAEDTRGRTLSVDVKTNSWFERSSYNQNGIIFPTEDQYIASCHAYVNSSYSGTMQLIGDYYSGKIYIQDPKTYTDNGVSIRREITTPHLIDRDAFFSCYTIELDIERSEGLDGSQQGSLPQVIMQYSKDRGHTWSNEIWRTASLLGNNRMRVRWGSIGGARVLTLRFRFTDPINWTIVNCTADIEREEPTYGRMVGLE